MSNTDLTNTFESNVNVKSNESAMTDFRLQYQTSQIERLMSSVRRNMFEIAARLKIIRDDKLYCGGGFKDVYDYALKVLGYRENFTRKVITACEKFIVTDTSGDMKQYYSVLRHEAQDVDYTISQLIELNSIETQDAVTMDANEVIKPSMTTREIRALVKSYKNGEIDLEGHDLTIGQTWGDADEEPETEVEVEVEDSTAKLCDTVVTEIDEIMKDTRVMSDIMTASKLEDFKKFLNGLKILYM